MRKSTGSIYFWEIFFTWAPAHSTVIMPDGRYHLRYVAQSRTRNESFFHLRFSICHFWRGSCAFYWAKTAHCLHHFTWSLKQLDVTCNRKVVDFWVSFHPSIHPSSPWRVIGRLDSIQANTGRMAGYASLMPRSPNTNQNQIPNWVFGPKFGIWWCANESQQSTVFLQNDVNSCTVLLWCKHPLVLVMKNSVMALTLIPQITKTIKSSCEILDAIQQVSSITLVFTCLQILYCVA